MKSYRLVHQLLSLVETFEKENEQEATLRDFAGFLVNHVQSPGDGLSSTEIRFGDNEHTALQFAYLLDNNISRLLLFMSRYAKSYIKKALEGTPLQTAEDFTCLAILLTHKDLSKSQLISHNIQEKTSGSVIINRLIGLGLIKQWADKTDKRGKRISITEEGRTLLYGIFEHTNHAGKIITGKLSMEEKLTLQYLLQKLENFHYPIYESKSVSSREDLLTLADSLVN
jgi:DNA-binding MarR family transcriptional regulator